MNLTHLSLFSGIGGLDLAAEWAGIETVGQCEWAEYPTKVLEKHWPDAPRWKDIRTLTGESFYGRTGRRTVDIISGGFPCQPFSVAGKQRGKEDDRYLWPEMVRVIKELRPTWIVGENVAGIVRMALPDILSELEACGYRTRTFLVPACAIGARHRRYRVAIVGYSEHNGLSSAAVAGGVETTGGGEQERKETAGESPGTGGSGYSKVMADSKSQTKGRLPIRKKTEQPGFVGSSEDVQHADSAGCEKQHVATESDEERFASWGCYEGNVCDATSEGLSSRSGKSVGGQGTQEQEPERPDSNVSDSNDGGRDVRRNGKFSTAEEIERTGSNIGKRKKEHESREWWSTESILGRVVDGIPCGMDGDLDFIINHYWDNEPDIPRIATGIEHRVDRLKCLGNAVVPQQFYPIFKAIAEVENLNHGTK